MSSPLSVAGAKSIIVIRHAEKTKMPGDANLSELGMRRAALLATALPVQFGKIDTIIAAKSSEKSFRPLRTVQPLALALKKPVTEWETNQHAELASAVSSDGVFNGQQIVLCWRHKSLHKLAMEFGAPSADPWSEDDYERLFVARRHPEFRIVWYRQVLDGKELQFVEVS